MKKRLRAAGIKVGRQDTSVITLLKRPTRRPAEDPLAGDGDA